MHGTVHGDSEKCLFIGKMSINQRTENPRVDSSILSLGTISFLPISPCLLAETLILTGFCFSCPLSSKVPNNDMFCMVSPSRCVFSGILDFVTVEVISRRRWQHAEPELASMDPEFAYSMFNDLAWRSKLDITIQSKVLKEKLIIISFFLTFALMSWSCLKRESMSNSIARLQHYEFRSFSNRLVPLRAHYYVDRLLHQQ